MITLILMYGMKYMLKIKKNKKLRKIILYQNKDYL